MSVDHDCKQPLQSQLPSPQCWIRIDEIRPRTGRVVNTRWWPPRPKGTNVCFGTRWFRFRDWQTQQIQQQPNLTGIRLQSCYSVYYCDEQFSIWPGNAWKHQVGDGSPNGNDQDDASEHDEELEDDANTDDWSHLTFQSPDDDGEQLPTFASHRELDTQVLCHRNSVIPRILPETYLDRTDEINPGFDGLNGKLALLIALIALSEPPGRLRAVIEACLQYGYHPEPGNLGRQCTFERRTADRQSH